MKRIICIMLLLLFCALAVSCKDVTKNGGQDFGDETVNENTDNENKAVLTSPPGLIITNSLHEMPAMRGGYYWEYKNKIGERVAEIADSAHPLDCKESLPVFSIYYTYQSRISPRTAYLMFDENPDEVSVTRWNKETDKSAYDSGEAVEISVTDDGYRYIELCESSIYEIYAEWETSEEYCGNARYSFCTSLVQPTIHFADEFE